MLISPMVPHRVVLRQNEQAEEKDSKPLPHPRCIVIHWTLKKKKR